MTDRERLARQRLDHSYTRTDARNWARDMGMPKRIRRALEWMGAFDAYYACVDWLEQRNGGNA